MGLSQGEMDREAAVMAGAWLAGAEPRAAAQRILRRYPKLTPAEAVVIKDKAITLMEQAADQGLGPVV